METFHPSHAEKLQQRILFAVTAVIFIYIICVAQQHIASSSGCCLKEVKDSNRHQQEAHYRDWLRKGERSVDGPLTEHFQNWLYKLGILCFFSVEIRVMLSKMTGLLEEWL